MTCNDDLNTFGENVSPIDVRYEFNAPRFYDFTAAASMYGGVVGDTNPPLTEASYQDDDEVVEFFKNGNPHHESDIPYAVRVRKLRPMLARELWKDPVQEPPLKPWDVMLKEAGVIPDLDSRASHELSPEAPPKQEPVDPLRTSTSKYISPVDRYMGRKMVARRTAPGSQRIVTPTRDEIRSGRRLRRFSGIRVSAGSKGKSSSGGSGYRNRPSEENVICERRFGFENDSRLPLLCSQSTEEHNPSHESIQPEHNGGSSSRERKRASRRPCHQEELLLESNAIHQNALDENALIPHKRAGIRPLRQPQRKSVAFAANKTSETNAPKRRRSVAVHLKTSPVPPVRSSRQNEFKERRAKRKSAPISRPLRVPVNTLETKGDSDTGSPEESLLDPKARSKPVDVTSLGSRRDNRNLPKPKRPVIDPLNRPRMQHERRQNPRDAARNIVESRYHADKQKPSIVNHAVARAEVLQNATIEIGTEKENLLRPTAASRNRIAAHQQHRSIARKRGQVRFTAASEGRSNDKQDNRQRRNSTLRKKIDEVRAENELAALLSRHNNNVNTNRRRRMRIGSTRS